MAKAPWAETSSRRAQSSRTTVHGPFSIVVTLWRVLRPEVIVYWRRILTNTAVACVTALAGVLGPYLLYLLLRAVLRGDPVAPWPLLVTGLILSMAAFAVFRFAQNDHALATVEDMFLDLKVRLVDVVMRKPAAFHTPELQAGLTALVSRDLDKISSRLRQHAGPMMVAFPVATAILVALILLDWRLGLPAAALTFLYLYFSVKAHQRTAMADARTAGADSQQQLVLTDILSGAHEIRLFQMQDQHRVRFCRTADAVRKRNVAVYGTPVSGFSPRVEFVGSMILIVPALLGMWLAQVADRGASPELIPAYMTYAAILLVNLRIIDTGLRALAVLGGALGKLDVLLHNPSDVGDLISDLEEMPETYTLELVNVTRGRGGKRVLAELNLTFAQGERVAVTGPSGIGKTTLTNLILRSEQPESGEVLLGGLPVERFPLPLYLSYFAHVGQTTHLFHASIRDNIGMGWLNVPLDEIVRAAQLVQLHDAIMKLPEGYDTVLGKDNMRLSHGQGQRLALARALIREPAILVLDEFTAALDQETEASILTDLIKGFPQTTIICMTHSPQVMRRMDRVFRLAGHCDAAPAVDGSKAAMPSSA